MRIFNCKSFDSRRDLLFASIVVIAIALYMAISCSYFAGAVESVKADVVRLHILANSNSEFDQKLKLKVRDALLETNEEIVSQGVSAENAREYFEESEDRLLSVARSVIKENGADYDVDITLGEEYFETRQYGDMLFPSGEYTALKVIIGEGKGRNWWCVMFPPLCVGAADEVIADKEKSADYLTESGLKIVSGGRKYVVKFKLLELLEEIKHGGNTSD